MVTKLKLSKQTIHILNSFSALSDQMVFHKGKTQRVSVKGPRMVEAEIEENIPLDFGIYQLKNFLQTLSLFDDPNIEFGENSLILSEGSQKLEYFYSEIALIKEEIPIEKKLKPKNIEVDFIIDIATLAKFKKAANILGMEYVLFSGDGSRVTMAIKNINTSSISNSYVLDIADTNHKFNLIVDLSKWIMVDGDYRIQLSSSRQMLFHHQNIPLLYFFTAEMKSIWG